MNKTRLIILPILAVIFTLFLGWSTISAQSSIEKFQNHILQIEALPSGSVFILTITEEEFTAAANEMLVKYNTEVQDMIEEMLGVRLTVSDPKLTLMESEIIIKARGGKGVLKVNASIDAVVFWDGNQLRVDVKSVDVPIVTVQPSTVNYYLQSWINSWVEYFKLFYEIRSFQVSEGQISLEAMKK